MVQKRDSSLDALCGILIIHMIIGHIFEWSSLTDSKFYAWQQRILFFFMPWFFFKSGMFYREKAFRGNIEASFRRLIVPLFCFTLLGMPRYWIKLYLEGDANIIHYLLSPLKSFIVIGNNVGNLPLWFLLALFGVTVICNFLFIHIKPAYALTISFALAAIENIYNFPLPHYIPNVLLGIVFYSSGHILSGWQYKTYVWTTGLIVYLFSIALFPQFVDVRTNTLQHGNYLLWFCISIASCMAFNSMFKLFQAYLPTFLADIGRDSLIYYVTHWLVISYTAILLEYVFGIKEGWHMWCVIALTNIIILPLCARALKRKKLRFAIGQ